MSNFKFTEAEENVIYSLSIDLDSREISFHKFIKSIEQIINERDGSECGEYQKCPKCDGQGIVSKPPWIAGDVFEWSSTELTHQCNVCNGAMIIQSPPKSKT